MERRLLLNKNAELSSPVSEGKDKRQLALDSLASALAKVIAQASRKLVLLSLQGMASNSANLIDHEKVNAIRAEGS